MPKPSKLLLFLDTGDLSRAQSAENQFRDVAKNFGLPWRASSMGLEQSTEQDLEQANHIIAMNRAEFEPILCERFPNIAKQIEYWNIEVGSDLLSQIEPEVMSLVSRILGGSGKIDVPEPEAQTNVPPPPKKPKTQLTARVGRETKGRRGKGVTTIYDLPISSEELVELGAKLKQKCGTGGTVKDGRIEIQGDQRDRVTIELENMGYKVKRVGG